MDLTIQFDDYNTDLQTRLTVGIWNQVKNTDTKQSNKRNNQNSKSKDKPIT